jgi:hypothetical protein
MAEQEPDVTGMSVREMRDLAWRSRRLARTVPTVWVIDTLHAYALELEGKANELERRADAEHHRGAQGCPA